MAADGALPIICQATGQLTCTSLADTGASGAFPNNTSTVFSNIFDSSADFSTVQYLGLSGIMLTTPPPVPPTLVSISATFDPSTTIQASSLLTLVGIESKTTAYFGDEGAERVVLNLSYDTTAVPQIGIGTILRGPNDFYELQRLVAATVGGSIVTPLLTVDPSSILSNITIEAPTSVMLEERACSGYTVSPTGGFRVYEPCTTPPTSSLCIIPSTTFTVANVNAQLGGAFPFVDPWKIVHLGTPWEFSPATLEFELVGNLSDSSTLPLGRYSLTPNLHDWMGPPRPISPPNLPGDLAWRWPISGPNSTAVNSVTPFAPGLPFTANSPGLRSRVIRIPSAVDGDLITSSSMSVGADNTSIPSWYTFTVELIGEPSLYNLAQLAPLPNPTIHRRLFAGGPYKGHATRKFIVKHDKAALNKIITRAVKALDEKGGEAEITAVLTLYATPVPTYDNLLQILCNELETDRLAGSNSAQILALLPINPTELVTNGYLYIPVPINDFVWRKLSDIHIKSITFELYNGAGSPPSYLENNDYVVTLQMRYK
jgi:hypothetical protein